MAAEMQRCDGLAERGVGGLQHVVHFRREPRRHIPVVGLRQHLLAALEPDPPVAERLVRLDVERGAHLGRRGLVGVAHALGDDQRRIGEPVIGAPSLQREGRALMAEKVGVEALDQRQRFEPADEARRPGRGLRGERARRRQQNRSRHRQSSQRRSAHGPSASADNPNQASSLAVKARSSSARFSARSAIFTASPPRALA